MDEAAAAKNHAVPEDATVEQVGNASLVDDKTDVPVIENAELLKEPQGEAPLKLDEFDVIIYSGEIDRSGHSELVQLVRRSGRRKNVYFVLTTPGGNPDTAYKIARCLQRAYERFVLFVPAYCKSAGTLIALGANELVLTEDAELGPLDIQVRKREELFEFSSSLDPVTALEFLRTQVMVTYRQYLYQIKIDNGLTTKMSAEMAAELSLGSFRPIYEQVDPVRLGELWRAINIAFDYGKRLGHRNLLPGALERLVLGYPSHGFVIDQQEAQELFQNVRLPNSTDKLILPLIISALKDAITDDKTKVDLLNSEKSTPAENPGDAGHAIDDQEEKDALEDL